MNYVINPSTSSSLQVYEKPMGNGVLSITTEKLLDIGNIPIRGGKVTAKFSFKNTGTGTLSLFS